MKILNILSNFNALQRKSFVLFMDSPFFELPEEALGLFKILKPHLEKEDLSTLQHQEVYEKFILENGATTAAAFNKVTHNFRKIIDQFLSHYELSHDTILSQQALTKSYANFPDYKYYQQLTEKELKRLKKNPLRNELYFLQRFQKQADLYFHLSTNKKEQKAKLLLAEVQQDLDLFYMVAKLRIAVELANRKIALAEDYQSDLLKETMILATEQESPAVEIYLELYELMVQSDQNKGFEALLARFYKNLKTLSRPEQASIISSLANHANQRFVLGEPGYLQHIFECYKFIVSHKHHIEEGQQISSDQFLNIVVAACLAEEFDFAYSFLSNNNKYLKPNIQKSVTQLSWAYIHFHENEYNKAWSLLTTIEMVNIDFKIRVRSLQLRCFYEEFHLSPEKMEGRLFSELENFRKFIYRLPKRTQNFKEKYYNKVKVIRVLSEFNPEIDDKSDFKNKWLHFLEMNTVTAKSWLQKKIENL